MPVLRITARHAGPVCHDVDMPTSALIAHAHAAARPGPVVIMIHGFKYSPGHQIHCPHEGLQSLDPRVQLPKAVSWPQRLGFGVDGGAGGLGISFGWFARSSVWKAWRAAEQAGHALAELLTELRLYAPGRPVHLFTHSMGARVAMSALSRAQQGDVKSAILMAPAEFTGTAEQVLAMPAGRAVEVLQVSSGENALFDALVQGLISPALRGDVPMGRRVADSENLMALRLDDPRALIALRGLGFDVAAPDRRVCHWSPYLRQGLFPLYRAFFSGDVSLRHLRPLLPNLAPDPVRSWPLLSVPKLSH